MGPIRIHVYLRFLTLSIWLSSVCYGQSPPPAFTYTLHAQKEPNPWSLVEIPLPPSTALATTPAGALLVLIPQPERKWVLKGLTDWYAQSPKEQSLAIGGSRVGRDEDVWISGDLTVTRDGKYAVVRITTRRRSSKPQVLDAEASIAVVDLNTFSAVTTRTTTDPLIAGAQWSLTRENLLVSKALTKRVRIKEQSASAVTDSYQAAILDLPDLKVSDTCSYSKVLEIHDGSGWRAEDEKSANLKCAGILKVAKVATANELPGENSVVQFAKEHHSPPSCNIAEVSDDGRFALYDCSEGHQAWDTVITTWRSLSVLSTASSASVLSITLKPKQPTMATLVKAESHDYLVVVRDGIRVEAYRIPEAPTTPN